MSTCLSICRDVPENGDMLNPQHRRGRYIKRHIRLGRWCFPRWQQNEGRPDIQASLSPLCTSLFPVSEEQEARKKNKKTSVLWFARYRPQQPAKHGRHISEVQILASFRAAGETTTFHLLLSSFHLPVAWPVCSCRIDIKSVFYFICVHSNSVQDACLRFISVVYMREDLDECVEGQHQCQQRCINTFGSFQCSCDDGYQPARDQTSCTGVCVCVCVVVLFYYISVCECLLHL